MTREGATRDMRFEVCNVTRALGSVSQMRRAGHNVASNPANDPAGSYIQHLETVQKMWLTENKMAYIC